MVHKPLFSLLKIPVPVLLGFDAHRWTSSVTKKYLAWHPFIFLSLAKRTMNQWFIHVIEIVSCSWQRPLQKLLKPDLDSALMEKGLHVGFWFQQSYIHYFCTLTDLIHPIQFFQTFLKFFFNLSAWNPDLDTVLSWYSGEAYSQTTGLWTWAQHNPISSVLDRTWEQC